MFKINCFLYILFSLFTCVGFSQQRQNIDQLILKVDHLSESVNKLNLLDSISKSIQNLQQKDFEYYKRYFAKYELQFIDLAKNLDSIDLAAFRTSRLTNHYLQVVGKPDSALVIVNAIIGDSNKIKNRINLGHLYVKKAGALYQTDDLEDAVLAYDDAQKVYHQTRDTIYEADAVYFNGQATERLGRLTEAVLKYQKASELYAFMKDTAYVAYSGLGISGIFSQLYMVDKSLEERQKIRNLLSVQKNKDYRALSELSINDARDFVKQKEYQKEEKAYLKALDFLNKDGNSIYAKFRVWSYLSEYYSNQNNINQAKVYLDSLYLYPDMINNPYDRIFYLKALGRYKLADKKYQEAIPILKEEIAMFKKSKDIRGQVHLEKELHKAYKNIGQYAEGSKHLERHLLLKDSIYGINRSNSIIYYRTLYETEKKESKIIAQKANINILEAKDKARRNLMIFGAIGMLLLFLLIYLYRNRLYLLRNKKLQQSFLQELLNTQEKVSKRISKDLHDGVGQSLLVIKNRMIKNDDPKTQKIVDDVIDEVRGISRSLHPFKLEELGLTVTLQSNVEMIDENYDIFISAEIDNIDGVFNQEKEINIYRLVQESCNNILKHSNARSAEIKVVNKENNVEIVIKDNGKGFDVSKEKNALTKIGLKTLGERSKFLNATLDIFSEINQGTTLTFNIPKHG